VDLTEEDDEPMDTPASPPPNVSDDSDASMDTNGEEDLLANYGINRDHDSDSDEDGFQHV